MGSVLVVGGWVELESEDAYTAWRAKAVGAAKLSGWSPPIAKPAPSAFDRVTIGALWAKAAEAPEPIEIVETARGVRFAAALVSVSGRELWAPALFAAVRRAAGAGSGGAWAMLAAEGGSFLSVELAGRGSFVSLNVDDDVERALAEPELARALELIDGDHTTWPRLVWVDVDELPPVQRRLIVERRVGLRKEPDEADLGGALTHAAARRHPCSWQPRPSSAEGPLHLLGRERQPPLPDLGVRPERPRQHPVDVERAVEVVRLVLRDASRPPAELERERRAVRVHALEAHPRRTSRSVSPGA